MAKVGQKPGTVNGNQTKRIRFIFKERFSPEFLMKLSAAFRWKTSATLLNEVDEQSIWAAVERLRGTNDFGDFIDSTKFDVPENGERLPLQGCFGLAASLALGF